MAALRPMGSGDLFDLYFRTADLNRDGHISGAEAVTFFQGSNLSKQLLAQIWAYADSKKVGYLGRAEFYNALKLVTVAQRKRELTPEIVKAAIYSPASANIPAPRINLPASQPRGVMPVSQAQGIASLPSNAAGGRGSQIGGSLSTGNEQVVPGQQNQFMRTPLSSTVVRPPESVGTHSPQVSSGPPGTRASDAPSSQVVVKDPNALVASGNGVSSDSIFGDVFAVASMQPKQQSTGATSTMNVSSISSGTVSAPAGAQTQIPVSSQGSLGQHSIGVHNQLTGRPGQPVTPIVAASGPASSHVVSGNFNQLSQPQAPWPKMTPADVQKYTKVFVQVDTDRDGKITGPEARNLFLNWKLPQEALKHIWDLSDQDNDSMLSLREFCIAVYLMERYREGRPLPPVFPSTIIPSESMFSVPGHSVATHGNASWVPAHGFQHQPHPGALRPPSIPKGKPPRPAHGDAAIQPTQPKRKIPTLEKLLVDQLSKEEQNSLNLKFEEATTVDKKVDELEKEIADSKQKIEYFRSKMQELVLYKSRCDNRYNEISERVSGDKRELESLAKKYEEKYKKSGNVGSKLTIEEATFRDIQEKKMELYQGIVKYEEGSPDDVVIKERTGSIQLGLEELVKTLNERCKQYGLRGKPTSLVELPFGWQSGIEEGAADWDEDWDKLEEEGFAFVKELTLDVQNIIAPSKEKSSAEKKEVTASPKKEADVSVSDDDDSKAGKVPSNSEGAAEKKPVSEHSDAKTPDSDDRDKRHFQDDSNVAKGIEGGSPHSKDTRRDDGEATVSSGGKFDSDNETDSVSNFNPDIGKEKDYDIGFGYGFNDFSIKPIKTGSTINSGDLFPGKLSIFADSVPSTPANAGDIFASKPSLFADSVPSTPSDNAFTTTKKSSFFDESVPSTPAYTSNLFADNKKSSFFDDSVPSTPAYSISETPRSDNLFSGTSPFMFDSVPSTPAHNSSHDFSSNSFSRFDSFNNNDLSMSRTDSMRSTSEPDPFASRFDSFNSQRYDSFNNDSSSSAPDTHGFPQTPKTNLTRFDSIGSNRDSDYSHGFGFDDHDPFKKNATTTTAETPRSSDHWNAF